MKRELIVERTARSSKYDRRNRIGRRPSDGVLWGGERARMLADSVAF
jgi:hypothetical protein